MEGKYNWFEMSIEIMGMIFLTIFVLDIFMSKK
jgi:hypothetical protein